MTSLQFQDTSLSITDLAGRSARWIRPNFKSLFAFFFWVQVLYHGSWEAFVWIIEKQGVHAFEVDSSRWALLLSFIAFIAIEFEVGARCVAIWSVMNGKESDLSTALKKARTPRLFVVFLPTILNELSVAIPMSFLLLMANEVTQSRDHPVSIDVTLLFGFLALLLWIIPFKVIVTANIFAAYTILGREGSIRAGLKKIWFFIRKAPLTVLYSLVLMGSLGSLIELPAMMTLFVDEAIKQFSGLDKTAVNILCLFLRLIVESTFSVVSLAFAIAAAALVDNELRIRLEGKDIMDKLDRIEKAA